MPTENVKVPQDLLSAVPRIEDPEVIDDNPIERGWYPEDFAPRRESA